MKIEKTRNEEHENKQIIYGELKKIKYKNRDTNDDSSSESTREKGIIELIMRAGVYV